MGVVRVLHMLHSMNRGGAENALMNYYRNINRSKVQFDFLCNKTKSRRAPTKRIQICFNSKDNPLPPQGEP